MKKRLIFILSLFAIGWCHAQVGINTSNPQGVFHVDPQKNTNGSVNIADDVLVTSAGRVGLGNITPSVKLDVLQTDASRSMFKLRDGNEAGAAVLVSDVNGVGTWTSYTASVKATLGAGVSVYIPNVVLSNPNPVTKTMPTGDYIDLPPGKWFVSVVMQVPLADASVARNRAAYWMRSTFHSSNAPLGTTLNFDPDIVLATQISGQGWYNIPSIISGYTIIRNSTLASKRYYYRVGMVTWYVSMPYTIRFGGTSAGENNIVAFRLSE